ncbi:hypothetical protein RQP46_004533 [Phenoliferia psychrophenolica]
MSFLRKAWGSGPAPVNGVGPAEPAKREWHTETPGERYFGMENFGNTCYANSVLQSLYFSKPFRELVEAYQQPHAAAALAPTAVAPASPTSPFASPPLPSSATLVPAPSLSSPRRPKSAGATSHAPPPFTRKLPSRPGTSAGRATLASAFGGHKRQNSSGALDALANGDTTPISAPTPPPHEPPPTPAAPHDGAPLAPTSSFTGVGTPSFGVPVVPNAESTLLTTLHDLFVAISAQPKTTGTVAPQAFINQLKRDNEFFRSTLHQDAHEFLNYLLNMIAEAVEKEEKARLEKEGGHLQKELDHPKTWVHTLFEGTLTNETRCLTCETVTSRDESFLDLSIDIEPNSSVTSCLRQFSASEMLCQRNKFFCDKCSGLQEAEKRMKIKKLPNILALHLKRFKYEESLQRHVKLTYRVVFPFELRLFNTADGVSNPDRLYELWAIVVHIGVGPHHGHYITIVKSGARWIVFDDNTVFPIEEAEIQRYFGDTPGQGSGYVLFYQAVDPDLPARRGRNDASDHPGASSSTLSSTPAAPPSWQGDQLPAPIPIPIPGSLGNGLGLELEAEDFVQQQHQPPPPSSPPVDAAHSFFPIPIPTSQNSSSPSMSAIPFPQGASSPSLEPPPSSSPSPSLPSTTPKSSDKQPLVTPATPKEKESGSGWTLRGRKSIKSKIGRSLSLATAAKDPRDQSRSASNPQTPGVALEPPMPTLPTSHSNGHISMMNGVAPVAFEPYRTQAPLVASPYATDADVPFPPSSPLPHEIPYATYPAPPSEDSTSTHSTSHANLAPTSSPQRRGSKASVDAGSSSSGPLAATRNIFGRRNSTRPVSSSGPAGGLGRLANGSPEGEGAALFSAPSSMSRKDFDKRAKEERKEEERKVKERAKAQKEEAKRVKEEAEFERKAAKRRSSLRP